MPLPHLPGSIADFGASANTIDVVVCHLDAGPIEAARLERLLAPEERERASQHRVPSHRTQFIAARALLRELLARVLGCDPAEVPLRVGASGKPELAEQGGARVRFSLAHSKGMALYGVMLDHDVGVDLEHVDDAVECEEIAARSFAPGEQRALSALPHGARRAAFFDCWTRKEAVVKASGEGLRRPLSSFVVSVEADCAVMLSCAPELGTPGSWFLSPVPVLPSHRAAVAVRHGSTVSMRIWS